MREILFRGKRVDNGEWITGYYIKANHHWHSQGIHEDWIVVDTIQNGGWCNVRGKYAVIPETIRQYTGLTDKNGTKIFEGDIVKTQERYDRPYSKNRKSKRHIGVVKYQVRGGDKFYNVDTGNWDKHIDYGAEWIVKVEDYGKFVHGAWGDFWDCEVIGNIIDNPELLNN